MFILFDLLLTCRLERLLVWPNDRAKAGENQCAQSASSSLWSAVVVERVLAQHKPVASVPYPAASHLPQQPAFQQETHQHRQTSQLQKSHIAVEQQ